MFIIIKMAIENFWAREFWNLARRWENTCLNPYLRDVGRELSASPLPYPSPLSPPPHRPLSSDDSTANRWNYHDIMRKRRVAEILVSVQWRLKASEYAMFCLRFLNSSTTYELGIWPQSRLIITVVKGSTSIYSYYYSRYWPSGGLDWKLSMFYSKFLWYTHNYVPTLCFIANKY